MMGGTSIDKSKFFTIMESNFVNIRYSVSLGLNQCTKCKSLKECGLFCMQDNENIQIGCQWVGLACQA